MIWRIKIGDRVYYIANGIVCTSLKEAQEIIEK